MNLDRIKEKAMKVKLEDREGLSEQFFKLSPRSQKIDPMFQAQFNMFYKAHVDAASRPSCHMLNIFASADISNIREDAYHNIFFTNATYEKIDFWKDSFNHPDVDASQPHHLPFKDKSFEIVLTTKIIMEHSSSPETLAKEIYRVLKPGGSAYIIAPLIRRQHQKPYDFFRFTEDGVRHLLLKKAGFSSVEIEAGGGAISALAHNLYFVQRSLPLPKPVEKLCDIVHRKVLEPILFYLDQFDNGYGKDFTRAHYVAARK